MDMNGWTILVPKQRPDNNTARIHSGYALSVSGDAARAISATGWVAAYSNRDGAIALRAATNEKTGRRRATRTGASSVKLTLTALRDLGYRPGQRFTVAQQGDLYVLTPVTEAQP
jgi:hypothetical protein